MLIFYLHLKLSKHGKGVLATPTQRIGIGIVFSGYMAYEIGYDLD